MNKVYIVDAARTAIGSLGGSLATVPPHKLAAPLVSACLARAGLVPGDVDEVTLGCVLQAGHGQNVARQVAVEAGIPVERTAITVNMVCGSGLRSVIDGARTIALGEAGLVAAGGTESMSLASYLLPKARSGYQMGNGELVDSMVNDGLTDVFNRCHMGATAENIAHKYGISRQEQDAFAAESQGKAETAIVGGRFAEEIVPIRVPQRKGEPLEFARDEFPRFGTTAATLAKLRPAFQPDGSVTAGNASGVNDGAACLLLASGDFVKAKGLEPMARIVSYAYQGVDPAIMGIGPVGAVRAALARAGWSIADLDLIEANEAFAVQAIAVQRELGFDGSRVNVNGGAIALGHPIGASGARILTTLLFEMRRRGAGRGLATLCIGGGMGIAMCVEKTGGR
ncbi:MAG: acetyl-CoA C-acetyltransferase [Rectinemataceae bacterium]|jgi:acetyl-CoA C-acetyltransferase